MTPDDGLRTTGTCRAWTNTSGGASTASSSDDISDSTDSVYDAGNGDCYGTCTPVYCDKEEEEELPVVEEPYNLPTNDIEIPIRDYFNIVREPP